MPVSIRGTSGGSVTLSSGAAATDTTLTLPNTTGTVALTASPTFSGTLTATTITSPSSTALTIQSAGTTAMTVDTSQNVYVGNTASLSSERLLVKGVALGGTAGNTSYNSVFYTPDTTNITRLSVLDYRVSNGTDHTTSRNKLQRRVDSTDMGYVGFDSTGTSIGWQNSEAMRLDTSGNLLVNCTATPSSTVAGWLFNNGVSRSARTTSASSDHILWINSNGTVGAIGTTGTSTYYNTSSDYRLKENVTPMTNALTIVKALKPVTYDWISDKSVGEGFIAHELQAVIPHAVTGEKDAVDEEGNIKPQGVDYSKIVVHLVAAIQELSAKNDALEARLAALEAK